MSSELFIPNKETPYFYIIQHKQSGKKYAGCRYAKKCNPIELLKQDGYTTSSKRVNKIIEKEGLESFQIVEILTEDQIGDVREYEMEFLVTNSVARSDEWLNLSQNKSFGAGTEEFKIMFAKIHGVENPSQIPNVKEKKKETLLKNYDVENPSQSEEIRNKVRETMLKNYNVENVSQSEEIKEKKRVTLKNNYGDEVMVPLQSEEVKEKHKKTMMRKYGVENPSQIESFKENRKRTMLEKYGATYLPHIKEAAKNRKWMYNNDHRVSVPPDKINFMLDNGYRFGRHAELPTIKFKHLEL